MRWIRTFEGKQTEKFNAWFEGSKVVNTDGSPRIVYHGTGENFVKFSMKKSVDGTTWFTTNKKEVENKETGAGSHGFIKELYISLKNPAGWDEYDKYSLGELNNMGYDGAILPLDDINYEGFVFHTNQIRIAK